MAKLTKEELIAKVNESAGLSEEEKISFMEDITDSFEVEEDNSELEQVKAELEAKTKEYDELVEKYKARFMSNEEVKEEIPVEPEMEEKKYVDVKDIFTEEKKEDDEE